LSLLGVAAAADRHNRRPLLRVRDGKTPGAKAAHRQARQVDALGIDLVLLLHLLQDRQRALAVSGVRAPGPVLGLWKDNDTREGLLVPADLGRDAAHLLLAVGPGAAGPVQEEDQRIRFVALVIVRHEDHVFGLLAVRALVDTVEEAVLGFLLGAGQRR